jgi:hypothetical protein
MSKKDKSKSKAKTGTVAQAPAGEQTGAKAGKSPAPKDPKVVALEAQLREAKQAARAKEAKEKEERKAERARLAAERKAQKAEPRPVCTGTKKDGKPCTNKAVRQNGDGTLDETKCIDHQPAWNRLTSEEHKAFGTWLRAARGPEIANEIGWYRAKQIAKETLAALAPQTQAQA